MSQNWRFCFLCCIWYLDSLWTTKLIIKYKLVFFLIYWQSYLALVHQFQYFVVLGCEWRSFKSIEIHCGFSPYHIISTALLHLNSDVVSCTRIESAVNPIVVIFVKRLVSDNTNNKFLIKICDVCSWLVVDLQYIFSLIYGS